MEFLSEVVCMTLQSEEKNQIESWNHDQYTLFQFKLSSSASSFAEHPPLFPEGKRQVLSVYLKHSGDEQISLSFFMLLPSAVSNFIKIMDLDNSKLLLFDTYQKLLSKTPFKKPS